MATHGTPDGLRAKANGRTPAAGPGQCPVHLILSLLVLAALLGCAHRPPSPLAEATQAQLGTIGVVAARFAPKVDYRTPAGWQRRCRHWGGQGAGTRGAGGRWVPWGSRRMCPMCGGLCPGRGDALPGHPLRHRSGHGRGAGRHHRGRRNGNHGGADRADPPGRGAGCGVPAGRRAHPADPGAPSWGGLPARGGDHQVPAVGRARHRHRDRDHAPAAGFTIAHERATLGATTSGASGRRTSIRTSPWPSRPARGCSGPRTEPFSTIMRGAYRAGSHVPRLGRQRRPASAGWPGSAPPGDGAGDRRAGVRGGDPTGH